MSRWRALSGTLTRLGTRTEGTSAWICGGTDSEQIDTQGSDLNKLFPQQNTRQLPVTALHFPAGENNTEFPVESNKDDSAFTHTTSTPPAAAAVIYCRGDSDRYLLWVRREFLEITMKALDCNIHTRMRYVLLLHHHYHHTGAGVDVEESRGSNYNCQRTAEGRFRTITDGNIIELVVRELCDPQRLGSFRHYHSSVNRKRTYFDRICCPLPY